MDTAALLAALRLQLDWGADEALAEAPIDRRAALEARADPPPAMPAPLATPASPARSETPAPLPRSGLPRSDAAEAARQAAQAAPTLDALRAAIAAFDRCGLRDTATNLVFADGPERPDIMLIGDVPAADDDRTGTPFSGPAGAFLQRILGSIGLGPDSVRTTTLVPWRPPGGRPASDIEIACCLPFLQRHIALAAPRFLLVVTGPAATAVTGESAARLKHNQAPVFLNAAVQSDNTIPALVLPSLASIRRSGTTKRQAWRLLRLLRNRLDEQR